MNATSLNQKTIRPGSLVGYSYYHSNRRPARGGKALAKTKPKGRTRRFPVLAIVLVVMALAGFMFVRGNPAAKPATTNSSTGTSANNAPKTAPSKAAPAAVPAVTNHCSANDLDRLVLVSVSQRHLWACQGATTVYDSPVVTGIQYLAADLTPAGTYHIYGKERDLTLTGSDTTGSWSDPVSYWMPFLRNQYGSYGFHDASWRANSDFGNISPNSSDASHGCVELPLSAAAWLYNWASVGTAVTIEN
jgi:lipoprotein-anchoring transpeptidase ErfK/SrfK